MPKTDPEPAKPVTPVEEPEPEESDRLQQVLTPRLDEDDEGRLASRIMRDYHAALQDRSEWEARLAEWEDQYYGRLPDKDFPWPGAANLHVPLTMMGVETYKPRLIESVLGQTPPIIVVPVEGTDEERKERTETFLNWQILTELNIEPIVTQSAHLFLQPGLALAKVTWRVDRIRRKLVREFPLDTGLDTVLQALFGESRPRKLTKTGAMAWTGTMPVTPQGGAPLEVTLRMAVLDEDDDTALQVLLDREEVIEHPHVDLIDPVDFIAPARGGHDIMDLPWCQHRLWLYEDDLRRKVLLKRFYADRVDELIGIGADGDTTKLDATAYKEGQARTEGVEDQGPSSARREQYEVLEDYRRWDVDGDGLEEEIIVWVSPRLDRKILGWDYLDNVYAHGRRPLRVGRYFPVPFRFYGLSFAEVVKGLQDEINTIHNQRVDYGTITNMPFYFYRASMTNPPIQQRVKPGSGVPVDNPQQDLLFPRWSSSPGWGHSEEALLHQYFERLTGLTDLTLGRQPNRVGATRTAAGTQTLLQEAGLRFKIAMEAFQRFWIGIFEDILALDQEYLPSGKEFRVTGKRPEFIRLKDRTEIRGRYDLRLAATAETLNRNQMRNDASMILQVLMNPALIQVGMVGLKGIQRAVGDFLKAFGKDPDYYLEGRAAIKSPAEELALFVSGVYVSPVQGEDIAQHLQEHQLQARDPDLVVYMKSEVREKLSRHVQETMQLARAQQLAQSLQMQGGRGAPMAQQAGNVERGQAAPQQPTQQTRLPQEGLPSGQPGRP